MPNPIDRPDGAAKPSDRGKDAFDNVARNLANEVYGQQSEPTPFRQYDLNYGSQKFTLSEGTVVTIGGAQSDINLLPLKDKGFGQVAQFKLNNDGTAAVRLLKGAGDKGKLAIEGPDGIKSVKPEQWQYFNPATDKIAMGGTQFFQLEPRLAPPVSAMVTAGDTRKALVGNQKDAFKPELVDIGREQLAKALRLRPDDEFLKFVSRETGSLELKKDGIYFTTSVECKNPPEYTTKGQSKSEELKPGVEVKLKVGDKLEFKPGVAITIEANKPSKLGNRIEAMGLGDTVVGEIEVDNKKYNIVELAEPLGKRAVESRYLSTTDFNLRATDVEVSDNSLVPLGKDLNLPFRDRRLSDDSYRLDKKSGHIVKIDNNFGSPDSAVQSRYYKAVEQVEKYDPNVLEVKPIWTEAQRNSAKQQVTTIAGLSVGSKVPGTEDSIERIIQTHSKGPSGKQEFFAVVKRASGQSDNISVSADEMGKLGGEAVKQRLDLPNLVNGKLNPDKFEKIADNLYFDHQNNVLRDIEIQGDKVVKMTLSNDYYLVGKETLAQMRDRPSDFGSNKESLEVGKMGDSPRILASRLIELYINSEDRLRVAKDSDKQEKIKKEQKQIVKALFDCTKEDVDRAIDLLNEEHQSVLDNKRNPSVRREIGSKITPSDLKAILKERESERVEEVALLRGLRKVVQEEGHQTRMEKLQSLLQKAYKSDVAKRASVWVIGAGALYQSFNSGNSSDGSLRLGPTNGR